MDRYDYFPTEEAIRRAIKADSFIEYSVSNDLGSTVLGVLCWLASKLDLNIIYVNLAWSSADGHVGL